MTRSCEPASRVDIAYSLYFNVLVDWIALVWE
jgi:hypothetical protein